MKKLSRIQRNIHDLLVEHSGWLTWRDMLALRGANVQWRTIDALIRAGLVERHVAGGGSAKYRAVP